MTNYKKILFILLFTAFGILALNIKLTHLAGSQANFTLFDSFAPIAGAFLGNPLGVLAVTAMQVLNLTIHGFSGTDLGFILRLFPMMFAVIFFGRRSSINLLVPFLAIIAFNLHPVGRTVWFYSLFWLIPVLCYFYQEKFLLARAFGATFVAHAVGGALWIWFFNLPKEVWIGLIPIVIIERTMFGIGIAINYALVKKYIFKYILKYIQQSHAIHQS